jgi:LuxR family maltose regulon positive regulatory protein
MSDLPKRLADEDCSAGVTRSDPVLLTKLFVPPVRAGLVPRPALVARLKGGLDGKLTLVSAPTGFGKTTLIVEWLSRAHRPVAWVSLDAGDNDPIRFFT